MAAHWQDDPLQFDNSVPGQIPCPGCNLVFLTADHVAEHLNSETSCWPKDLTAKRLSAPPAFLRGPSPQAQARARGLVLGTYHRGSDYIYGHAPNLFQQMQDNEFERRCLHNTYYLFQDQLEWELGRFICETMTASDAEDFLKLQWVNGRQPSFKDKRHLYEWMESLPQGTPWKCTEIQLIGYKTTHPIYLIWRDGLEVIKMLFSNPIFTNIMAYDPHAVFVNGEREFGEFFSSKYAWVVQDLLPEGATIIPVMAASDKTPVTSHTGNLEMHPLFLTVGNIQADVRMKATSHSWSLAAFMPTVKFEVHSDYQTILQARLWHKCMDIVCANLKIAARTGVYAPDPLGQVRYCFTPLVAYTADLPEQQMIANVTQSSSPITLARVQQFGDGTLHPPRDGKHTLQQLVELDQIVDPWDVDAYQKKSKERGLLGVHQPFWRNWGLSEPAIFLVPEILHTGLKFFFDHPLKWCKEAVGKRELDARYKSMHKRVGVRHFSSGVSHVQQMTGREHRDIQRTIVAAIAGATSEGFVRAIRDLVKLIYLAQNPVHTQSSIQDMDHALRDFHSHKHFIIQAEAWRTKAGVKEDFNIPKLKLFQSFANAIENVGSLVQYTADVSERLLITHCKRTFQRTSHNHDFAEQIVRILDHNERMRQFDLYALMRSHNISLINTVTDLEQSYITYTDPALSWIREVLPGEQMRFMGPRPVRNHFLKGILRDDARAAFSLTVKPDSSHHTIQHLCTIYQLWDLPLRYETYVGQSALTLPNVTQNQFALWNTLSFRAWKKFRIQLLSAYNERIVMPSHLIQAYPPSTDFPLGCADAVLIDPRTLTMTIDNPSIGPDAVPSAFVGQIRAIFQPQARGGLDLPAFLSTPLVYVNLFDWMSKDRAADMWIIQRREVLEQGGSQRVGAIVPLVDIMYAVELIPVYGERLDCSVTQKTSQEVYSRFYLNSFADKEVYHSLQSEL